MLRLRGSVLIFIGCVASCYADAALPAKAKLSCGYSGECPPGYVCHFGTGYCQKDDPNEFYTKIFESQPSVLPGTTTIGKEIVVNLDYVDYQPADPTVYAKYGQDVVEEPYLFPLLEFDLDESQSDRDNARFRYRHAVQGIEKQGRYLVIVPVFDATGRKYKEITCGMFELDFRPPSVLGYTISEETVTAGQSVELTLFFDEALSASATVRMSMVNSAESIDWGSPVETQGIRCRYSYTPSGSEVEGAYRITVDFFDVAGNQNVVVLDQGITLSF